MIGDGEVVGRFVFLMFFWCFFGVFDFFGVLGVTGEVGGGVYRVFFWRKKPGGVVFQPKKSGLVTKRGN